MKLKLLLFATYLLVAIPILQDGIFFNPILTLLNLVLAAICVVSLFLYTGISYSLFKIYHLFVLFFFCIAPAIQYKNGVRFFETYFSERDYILASTIILLMTLVYNCVYRFFYHSGRYNSNNLVEQGDNVLKLGKEFLLLSISSGVCLYYLYINDFNIFSLLFRGGEFVERVTVEKSTSLIANNFLRPMPVIAFLVAYLSKPRHKIILPILFVLMLIAAPPTGMPRFSAAAMYLPVFLFLFPRFQKKYNFIFLVVLGLLVVFPFLDVFRYFTADGLSLSSFRLSFDQFEALHFDSYSMFMRVMKSNVITYGRQLLGVLFFFVPRSLWPNKPIGSGHYIGEVEWLEFTNLSMPFLGEGYINFGIIGVLFFIVVLAFITGKVDSWYWLGNGKREIHSSILYIMLLGLFLLVLRGDLMSSFAYVCGFVTSNIVVKKILRH